MEGYVMSRERKLFPRPERSWSLFHLANSMRKAVTKRARSVFEVESRLRRTRQPSSKLRISDEICFNDIPFSSPQCKLRSLSLFFFLSRGYAISSRVPSIIFPRITFNRLERYVLLLVQPYLATIQESSKKVSFFENEEKVCEACGKTNSSLQKPNSWLISFPNSNRVELQRR